MVTVHPTWICPGVTSCLVSTDLARSAAINLGMPPDKVKVCGQPVSLKFSTLASDKCTCRQQLGLAMTRPTVLLMGGGEGRGPVLEMARSLAQSVPQAQLLIVTGRNKRLKAKLEAIRWEIPTRVYGFVDNMPALMGAADLLLTKAGPGTLSEAFIAGLPVLIYDYLPGQEAGNVAYVEQHRVGVFAASPPEITRLVQHWLDPAENSLEQMARNARSLARPNASGAIATDLHGLLQGTNAAQPGSTQLVDRGRTALPGRSGNRRS
jgi:1,2-diacylglycerol 3-beta-galactosyltransferase